MAAFLANRVALQASCASQASVSARRPLAKRAVSRSMVLRAASTVAAVETKADKKLKSAAKEAEEEDDYEMPGLTPQQVGSLLSVLCDETDIAEVELKLGGFQLKVRRKLEAGEPVAVAAPAAAPVAAAPAPVAAAAPAPASPALSTATLDEEDIREMLVIVQAPKVGIMRTARYLKGKQVSKGALVKVGDRVKKGQIIGFIEQMGTHVPIEAPQAGEVVALMKEDGDPVEYDEELAELSPFFGGHIIGDAKYV